MKNKRQKPNKKLNLKDLKKVIFLTFLLYWGIGISQTKFPFYEQIAFDFYQSKIIDSFPKKSKIKVYPYVMDFHPLRNEFYHPFCLGLSRKNKLKKLEFYLDSQLNIDSERFELDFSNLDKNKFKIKRNGKGNYPKLKITTPYIEINGSERIFVNIHIISKNIYETYHIEFNNKGKIIDWCRTYDEVIRFY